MKLRQLLQGIEGIEVRGSKEVDITGIATDSRTLSPGNLFIAKKGDKHDGSNFINEALASGAKAIVTDLFDPFLPLPQIICSNPGKWESKLSAKYFGYPSQKLFVVGVTGSKGKTTTTYLCKHLMDSFEEKCGLLGTIETIIGDNRIDSRSTTREAWQNQKLLKEMVKENCKAAVLEVSSHGLSQGRVEDIAFNVAIFTNLYPDHLDYHKTIDAYAAAKKKLFIGNDSILNVDSPWASYMRGEGKSLSVGIQNRADIQATDISFREDGTEFFVSGVRFQTPLMGIYNVYNVLCAIGLGTYLGKNLTDMSSVFQNFPNVPGRMEKVPNDRGIHVFVDYAHTGESLDLVLGTLKRVAKGKMLVVFGCGGDRDKARRKGMAQSAEKYADVSIITTDNPRNEDPETICQEIVQSFSPKAKTQVILDRYEAIERAISFANPGDFVVIAGKGHEKVQIFLNRSVTFDDVATASEVLRKMR